MRILSLYDKGNGGEIVANKEIRKIEIQVETVGTERARKYLKQAEKDESDLTKLIEKESKKRQKILEEEQLAANKLAKRTRYSRRRLKTAISQESVSLGGKRRIARTGAYKDLTKAEQNDLANQMWDGRIRAPFTRSRRKKEHIAKFHTMFKKGNSPDPSRQNTDPMAKYWGKASGDWTKINEANSAFASGQTTQSMARLQDKFRKQVIQNTGFKKAKIFGNKSMDVEDDPIKSVLNKAHAQAIRDNVSFDRNALKKKKERFNSAFKKTKSKFGKKDVTAEDNPVKAQIEKAHIQALKDNVKFDRSALAEKKRRFNSIFKTKKRKFGEQMPHGTEELLNKRRKDYSNWWNSALGDKEDKEKLLKDWLKAKDDHSASLKEANLRRGQQQQSDYFARAKSNMAKYRDGVSANKARTESYNKAWKDVGKGALDVRNSFGSLGTVISQAIGELTMFAGALTMVGFMATAIFQKMLSVGDAFASIETDFTTGAAFRHSLYQTGGIKSMAEFDRANALNQKYSGLDQYKSAAMLARAGTQIREMKGSVNESTLSNLSTAAYGAAAITGDDAEKTMQKVLEVAKKGKGTDKLGLAELKLTKNMDENLEIIASAIKKDPIASAILRRGTVSSAMERIRNAPKQLLGNVFGQHREQATGIFNRIGNTMMKVANDPEVIQIWSRALTNLENVVDRVFTEENMKAVAMGGAQWGAELSELAGKAMDFAMWFAKNSDLVLTMTKWFVRIWGFISAIKLVVGMGKLVADLYAFGGAIAALKATLAGGGAAGAAGAGATGAGKTIIAGAGAAATKASKLLSPFLSRKLLFGTGLGFFMNSTEVGSGEEDLLSKYNLSKQVGSNVYDLLDLRNSVGNTVNSNNGMGVYDYTKPMPSQSQPMPAWNNPNAKVIVLNDGDVVIDSKLVATELYLQDMGGL